MNSRQKLCLLFISALLIVLAVGCGTNAPNQTMIGFWADANNVTTTIEAQSDLIAAVSVFDLNQPQGKNLLDSSSFAYGVLTWRYCLPDQTCMTLSTVTVSGDSLNVNWTDNKGQTGKMTLKRVAKGTP